MSLEAIARRNIRLHTVVYNLYPEEKDDIIRRDTESYIRHLLEKEYPETRFVTLRSYSQKSRKDAGQQRG